MLCAVFVNVARSFVARNAALSAVGAARVSGAVALRSDEYLGAMTRNILCTHFIVDGLAGTAPL